MNGVKACAIAGGTALTCIEAFGCWQYLHGLEGGFSYIVAGGVAVPFCAPLLAKASGDAWRDRRAGHAIIAFALLMLCIVNIVSAAIERTGSARDNGIRERAALEQERVAKDTASKAAKAEYDLAVTSEAKECATGQKTECTKRRAETATKRKTWADADAALADVPPPMVDSKARRLTAIIPGLTEVQVQLYDPLVTPLTISFLALFFLSYGLHGEKKKPETRVTLNENVEVLAPEPLRSLPRPQQQRLGSVTRFLLDAFEPGDDAEVEVADIYRSYRRWCERQDKSAAPGAKIGELLFPILGKAGIRTRQDGDNVYCVGVKLAA